MDKSSLHARSCKQPHHLTDLAEEVKLSRWREKGPFANVGLVLTQRMTRMMWQSGFCLRRCLVQACDQQYLMDLLAPFSNNQELACRGLLETIALQKHRQRVPVRLSVIYDCSKALLKLYSGNPTRTRRDSWSMQGISSGSLLEGDRQQAYALLRVRQADRQTCCICMLRSSLAAIIL